jgi:hypothetical protein
MKQTAILIFICISVTFISCSHHRGNIDISVKDAGHYFFMDADFHESKTRQVERYMNSEIGEAGKLSFFNTHTNAMVTLDDDTKFYLREEPGHLYIKFDKDENSPAAYYRIKSMCEGVKEVLTR